MNEYDSAISTKVDQLIVKVTEMHTDLKHFSDRADRQCERIENMESKVDDIERRLDKHDGELTFASWAWKGLVGIGVIAAAIAAFYKGG